MNKSNKILMYIANSLLLLVIISAVYTHYTKKDIQCIDGDTFSIGNVYYRLAYIDTTEKGEPTYVASSKFACDYLKHNDIHLTNIGTDIYDRKLVVVNIDKMYSLNDLLVKECLAEPFYSKTTDNIINLYNKHCK